MSFISLFVTNEAKERINRNKNEAVTLEFSFYKTGEFVNQVELRAKDADLRSGYWHIFDAVSGGREWAVNITKGQAVLLPYAFKG